MEHLHSSDYFREIAGGNEQQLHDTCQKIASTKPGVESNPAFFGLHAEAAAQTPWRVSLEDLLATSEVLTFINTIVGLRDPMIFSMCPNTVVPEHTDPQRTGSINMLINGFDSRSLFLDRSVYYTELVYKPNTLFLYNSRQPHLVINNGQHRHLLTISLRPTRTFNKIADCLQRNNLIA